MRDMGPMPDDDSVKGQTIPRPNIPDPLSKLPNGVVFHALEMKGAWIVYSFDAHAYPIGLYSREIEALRACLRLGYGKVKFWEFGTDWSDND